MPDPRPLIELADSWRAIGHEKCADELEAVVNLEYHRAGVWIPTEADEHPGKIKPVIESDHEFITLQNEHSQLIAKYSRLKSLVLTHASQLKAAAGDSIGSDEEVRKSGRM